ncbi:MAG: hypothetical protein EA368_09020 [Leptolyngbya sp. DLM2.Bin27]|nr:MAG: hypothetical protein EA368_09020 [Leptolyngbya sp. DLM2.Bin27]
MLVLGFVTSTQPTRETFVSQSVAGDKAPQNLRLAGSMKGTFVLPLPDNFDEPLKEFEGYM